MVKEEYFLDIDVNQCKGYNKSDSGRDLSSRDDSNFLDNKRGFPFTKLEVRAKLSIL